MALQPSLLWRTGSSASLLPKIPFPRSFSATTCSLKVSGPLPTFEPTSNPELDSHLDKIRNELFIPAHLLRRHRNMMYRKKNHHILNEEPLYVDVSGHQVPLTPKTHQVPIGHQDYTKALNLAKAPTDLDIIPGLLQGFAQVKRPLDHAQLEKTARSLTMNGRIDLLMELATNAGRNGFMFTPSVAREFMRGVMIQSNLPAKESATKALHYVEQLLRTFAQPLAKAKKNDVLARDPVVVGTALYIASDIQVRFNDGKDFKGVVNGYAERLQAAWDRVEWNQGLADGNKNSFHKARLAVLDYTPVLEGMSQAREILAGSTVAPWLASESAKLSEAVNSWAAFRNKNRATFGGNKELEQSPYSYKKVAEALAQDV